MDQAVRATHDWGSASRVGDGVKRGVDMLLAAAFLVGLALPVALLLLIERRFPVLRSMQRVGLRGRTFAEFRLERLGVLGTRLRLDRYAVLVNILKGDISFIGPRTASPGEFSLDDQITRVRYEVRPGIIGPWWIRRRTNVAYGTEAECDAEYVRHRGLATDIGIALRALPAVVYGCDPAETQKQVTVLGIKLDNLSLADAVDHITTRLEDVKLTHVCFVNADCANIAYGNADYRTILARAELTLADGIGLKLAGRLLGQPIKQNVNGTDMFPPLCKALAASKRRVFLLGARPGVPEKVRDWIASRYDELTVCGWQHGYFEPDDTENVVRRIRESRADVILVAFGSPYQDLWLSRHLRETGAKVGIGVGGLFDFYSGRIRRAPGWMREIGLEWVYRLIQEPRRMWRRYLVGNVVFLYRVIKERSWNTQPPVGGADRQRIPCEP